MDPYVTGTVIHTLRDARGLTQAELAEKISVSSKAVSKWETGHGYPDITLLEPLAEALGVSILELLRGAAVHNYNKGANMLRTKVYQCPICRNVITATGDALISCCGITLLPLEQENPDMEHSVIVEPIEDEWFLSSVHPMTKEHYLTFFLGLGIDSIQLIRLYPEGNAEARLKMRGVRMLLCGCNRHGMYRIPLPKK